MNSLHDSFKAAMDLLPALVFIGMGDMLRAFLTFEIEDQLGRKLTDWEWQYFLQERKRKAEVDSRQRIVSQWRQQMVDRQIIHDFAWGESNSGNS
jgi:hypothetical protein